MSNFGYLQNNYNHKSLLETNDKVKVITVDDYSEWLNAFFFFEGGAVGQIYREVVK